VKVKRDAGRLSVTAKRPAQVLAACSALRRARGRHFEHEHIAAFESENFSTDRQRRSRGIGDQRLDAQRVGSVVVPRPRSGDAAIVFNAHKQPADAIARTIGEANHRFDQLGVGKHLPGFALELDVERFSGRDQSAQFLDGH
jgi:hypothetical protein